MHEICNLNSSLCFRHHLPYFLMCKSHICVLDIIQKHKIKDKECTNYNYSFDWNAALCIRMTHTQNTFFCLNTKRI